MASSYTEEITKLGETYGVQFDFDAYEKAARKLSNLDTQGVPGVLMWICILAVAFAAVGFAFFGLDRLGKKKDD